MELEEDTKYYTNCLVPTLEENGIDLHTVISYPKSCTDKTPLRYSCVCGNDVVRSIKLMRKRPLCNSCCPTKKTGTKAFKIEQYIELAKECDYEYIKIEGEEFVNTKSRMTVRNIKTNEICKKSYNNLQSGVLKTKKGADDDKKKDLADIKILFLRNNWKWVEGTVYVNNRTPIPAICHCGNEFMVAVHNIRENRVGCPDCYHFNRKYTWEYIEGYADNRGCIVSELPSNPYRGRDTYIHMICVCEQEVIKTARQFLKSPRCKACSCKYGEDNYFGKEYGKNTVRAYWMEHYGVSHNMKVPEIQLKAQETCMQNYDVNCVFKLKEVRDSAVESHIEKHGAPPGCVKEFHEKRKATTKDKFGNECYLMSESGLQHMTDKYGYPYACQNDEILERQQKSCYALKIYVFPSGREELIQGYEDACLNFLILKKKIPEDDIVVSKKLCPLIMYELDGKTCRYFMDFYIKSQDKAIEVKSTWTYSREQEKNTQKWIAASKICSSIDVYVFDKKKTIVVRKTMVNGKMTKHSVGKNKEEASKIPVKTFY